MEIINNTDIGFIRSKINEKTAVALGNFDGLHIGHMALIDRITEYAKEKNISSCVWTFAEHSLNIIKSDYAVPYITSREEKIEILKQKNIE